MNDLAIAPAFVVAVLIAYLIAVRNKRRRLTPVSKPSEDRRAKTILAANAMVCDFGDYLLKFPLAPTEIRDSSCLPHAKDLLLMSYPVELAREENEERRAALKVTALELAQFQADVGPAPLFALGFDLIGARATGMDADTMARLIADNPNRERYERFQRQVKDETATIMTIFAVNRRSK